VIDTVAGSSERAFSNTRTASGLARDASKLGGGVGLERRRERRARLVVLAEREQRLARASCSFAVSAASFAFFSAASLFFSARSNSPAARSLLMSRAGPSRARPRPTRSRGIKKSSDNHRVTE